MTQTSVLTSCEGFHVLAEDGLVGEVERPLIPPDRADPDFLVVRLPRRLFRTRLPVVSTALVSSFDLARRVIWVRGSRREIASLPEHIPLALTGARVAGMTLLAKRAAVASRIREPPPKYSPGSSKLLFAVREETP